MATPNEKIKEFILATGRKLEWVSSKIGVTEEELKSFLNGFDIPNIIPKIENLFGLYEGIFESESFDAFLSNYQSLHELKTSPAYKRKRDFLEKEINLVLTSFPDSYFNDEFNELILNKDGSVYLDLSKIDNLFEIPSPEEFKIELVFTVLRMITVSNDIDYYLNSFNNFFSSDLTQSELVRAYKKLKTHSRTSNDTLLHYLVNNNFDLTLKNYLKNFI